MIQYYYTKKEWGVVMEKEKLKILEELRRILNNKNEAIIILNNYFKGGVGKSKLSTMFAYLTDKLNLKVLMIDKDLQATLTKDLAKTFEVELPRVNFYEGLKNGNLASSIVHLTDNLDLIPGTFDLMLLPKLTRSWTFENESRLLATLLAPLKSDYDLIIIDTVPTPSVYLGAQKAKRNDTPISAKKDIMGDKTVRVRADLHHIIKIETAKNGGNVKEVMDQALEEYIRKYLPDKL